MSRPTKIENVIPQLPSGVRVTDKRKDLELLVRSSTKYVPIIEALKVIDATKNVEWDTTGMSKNQVSAIKMGIKKTGAILGFKHKIRFAADNGVLYIFCNRI